MASMTPEQVAEIDALLGIIPDRSAAPQRMEEDADRSVAAVELADWLGLTPNRVNALAREGTLPRGSDNLFPLKAAVQAYAAHARAGAMGRRADVDLAAEKLRLAREGADKLALANASARGELLDARAVATAWRGIVTDLRAALLAVPSRVAATLGLDRPATLALDAEVRASLEVIADDR